MLNTDRLRAMTRLAMAEQKEADECAAAETIRRRDYVSFHGSIGFFVGSFLYVALYVLIVCALMFTAVYAVTESMLVMLFIAFVVGYLAFILFFTLAVRRRARRRYNEADEKLRRITALDDELLAQYTREKREHLHDSIHEISG